MCVLIIDFVSLSDNLLGDLLLDYSCWGRLSDCGVGDGLGDGRLWVDNKSLGLDWLDVLGLIELLLEDYALLLGLLLGFSFGQGKGGLDVVNWLNKSNKGEERKQS